MTPRRIFDCGYHHGMKPAGSRPARARLLLTMPAVAAAAVVAMTGTAAAAAPSAAPAGGPAHAVTAAHLSNTTTLKTAKIGKVTVLTSAKGFTLYSFAPDTATMSKCNGSCAQVWPPVKGPASAAGVKGKFGTIKRADGSVQATYNGHPLYTFTGDTAPKQTHGNGLNVNGGVWHEVTTSGKATSGGSSTGSGGGSGY